MSVRGIHLVSKTCIFCSPTRLECAVNSYRCCNFERSFTKKYKCKLRGPRPIRTLSLTAALCTPLFMQNIPPRSDCLKRLVVCTETNLRVGTTGFGRGKKRFEAVLLPRRFAVFCGIRDENEFSTIRLLARVAVSTFEHNFRKRQTKKQRYENWLIFTLILIHFTSPF